MTTSTSNTKTSQPPLHESCCCSKLQTLPDLKVAGSRFGGERLYHAYKYEPLKVCLPNLQMQQSLKTINPCGCPEDFLIPPISKEEVKEQRHLERCKEMEKKKAYWKEDYNKAVKKDCITEEQLKKQYKTELVKECPKQDLKHLHEICPWHVDPTSFPKPLHGELHPKMQQTPLDCPCRRVFSKEQKERMQEEDCRKKLCEGPCKVSLPSAPAQQLHCRLYDLCKVPVRRREAKIKKGRWDDVQKCQWDYWDKSSPYWENEEISQLLRQNTIPGYSHNFDRDTETHVSHSAEQFRRRLPEDGDFRRRTTELSEWIEKVIEYKNIGLI